MDRRVVLVVVVVVVVVWWGAGGRDGGVGAKEQHTRSAVLCMWVVDLGDGAMIVRWR